MFEKAARELGFDPTQAIADADRTAIRTRAKETYLAVSFIMSTDRRRTGKIIQSLENQHTQGSDNWPRTLDAAYNLVVYWKPDFRPNPNFQQNRVSFATGDFGDDVSELTSNTFATKGQGGKDKSRIKCFRCGKFGHYANENKCEFTNDSNQSNGSPQTDNNNNGTGNNGGSESNRTAGVELFMNASPSDLSGVSFNLCGTISDKIVCHASVIPASWILLDNQSNVDVFCNGSMLTNIHESLQTMRINSHGGAWTTNQQGFLPGYGNVWYDPNGIANILSLSHVKSRFRVTYDSKNGDQFVVHKPDGSLKRFQHSSIGLYFFDTASSSTSSAAMVTTVHEKMAKYSDRDVLAAKKARHLQDILGRPSTRDFIRMVSTNSLPNCPITVDDIRAAEDIFGPNLGSLIGKTTRTPSKHVSTQSASIPIEIIDRYRNVTLAMDVMKVKKFHSSFQFLDT